MIRCLVVALCAALCGACGAPYVRVGQYYEIGGSTVQGGPGVTVIAVGLEGDRASIECMHLSHLTKGPPFNSQKEDYIEAACGVAVKLGGIP